MVTLTSDRLIDALRALDSEQRALITLFVAYSLTDAEIGAVMGLSSAAIAQQRSEAIARLSGVLDLDAPRSGAALRGALLALSSQDWDAAARGAELEPTRSNAELVGVGDAATASSSRRRFSRRTPAPTAPAEGEPPAGGAPASEGRPAAETAHPPSTLRTVPRPQRRAAVALGAVAAVLGAVARAWRGRATKGARRSAWPGRLPRRLG